MYTPPHPENVRADIGEILKTDLPWASLANKNILVTGAAGMLAAYIVDTLLYLPEVLPCAPPQVIALVRNKKKAELRFAVHLSRPNFSIATGDICKPLNRSAYADTQVIIHAASIPRPDGKIPVDVMAPNILGTWHLLEAAREFEDFEQFLFFSSGIVNGDDIQSDIPISEKMYFASSCTSPGACYSESKRAGETICLSFMRQYGIPVKLLRYFGSYGPGMDLHNDPRAFTAFIKNSVCGEDIVLLSTGEETRFYCYITDATEAFFRVYFSSVYGEVWNIANNETGCTIRELAEKASDMSPYENVVTRFDPTKVPAGYTPFQSRRITVPDIKKLRETGFTPKIGIREGLRRTIAAYSPACHLA